MAGPPLYEHRNYYIIVMIEHSRMWVEVAALPSKDSSETARVFRRDVLCRYGAPAKVSTDLGIEFGKEFSEMLDDVLIDHRRTSRDHLQTDGLAESMGQNFKAELRKACLSSKASAWRDRLLGRSMTKRPRRLGELILDDERAEVQSVTKRA